MVKTGQNRASAADHRNPCRAAVAMPHGMVSVARHVRCGTSQVYIRKSFFKPFFSLRNPLSLAYLDLAPRAFQTLVDHRQYYLVFCE